MTSPDTDSRERELWGAYEAAVFRVSADGAEICFRVGVPSPELDRLLEHFGATTWAHITAWNPRSVTLADEENEERQRRLLAVLEQGGWVVLDGDGSDPSGHWPPEPTAFVLGISVREAKRLGMEFGQLAIVVGQRGAPPRQVPCASGTLDNTHCCE